MKENLLLTATEQARKISKGELCPVELTEAYINEIDTNSESDCIYTNVMKESALADALLARRRVKDGKRLNSLDGILISWKDLFDTKGLKTEAGTTLLSGRIPRKNALVIEKTTKAGIINIGKTHMTEFAFSGLGVNPKTRTPPNSISSELAPGGSSSGAAVSVGLRLASAAVGSDTGGSVRVPASWNNLVGLKTTFGLISLDGVVPLCPNFDTVGPIVRCVDDAYSLISLLTDRKERKLMPGRLKVSKLAIIKNFMLQDLDSEIRKNFEETIEFLRIKGIKIEFLETDIFSQAIDLGSQIISPEAYSTWQDLIEKNPSKMHKPILDRFRTGLRISAPAYIQSWQKLKTLRKKYAELTSKFNAILAPTTPILPPVTKDLLADDKYFSEQNLLALRNTRISNLLGLPSLTIPTKKDFCGLMLMGQPFEEINLLEIGRDLELLMYELTKKAK